MKKIRTITIGLAVLSLVGSLGQPGKGATGTTTEKPPHILGFHQPRAGLMEIIFHGTSGPFMIQMRDSLDASSPWYDVPDAIVTELQPGVFITLVPKGVEDLGMYRVVSESDGIAELKGWTILAKVSVPANGLFFVPGESPVVTVTILDTFAQGLAREAFSTLNLYMYGPQDPKRTVTASKLLNASIDRAARPHHYIDLKTNPEVKVKGNVLTYPLRAVTDEQPGTYTVSVWSSLASDPVQQIMKFANIQIGTGTVENPVVAKTKCASCHEGTISGKMYLHHIDPGNSPIGSWSLDYDPVRTCKSCHNNDGYSAYSDASAPGGRVVDPIIRRVHGVHMGEHLKLPFNTDPAKGDFSDYIHVVFPADVKNCAKCHLDDRWKTQASRLACGACHDNVWFGSKTQVPTGMTAHTGGAVSDDNRCAVCHVTDGLAGGVDESHKIDPPAFKQVVNLEMTPPANGKFYVAGEAPKVTIKITDAATGKAIDPRTMLEPLISTNPAPTEWRRASFYVSGPRSQTVPVLTTAAAKPDPTRSYANNDFRVRLDKTKEDPRITRAADSIIYALDDVAKLAPGTYTAFAEILPAANLGGWAYLNFQVGTATPEPMIATNCTDCHENTRQHGSSFAVTFTPDICKNCHDYQRQMPGKTSWSESNNGFGAAPLARRIHGVHFGNYLDKPKEVHRSYDFSHVIFPQDVRNCTKCHSQTASWTEKPSRVACLACHDGDVTIMHTKLMTFDPTPQEGYSGDEVETCIVCHSKDSAFAPNVVHSISKPYVPPYRRAAR